MSPESAFTMISVDEALAIVLANATPLGSEVVPLLQSVGRVLAVDVASDQNLPAMPRSSVDGYAVLASDSTPVRRVVEVVTAGQVASNSVGPGTAAEIMTGAPLPNGADAVIMVEDSEQAPQGVRFSRPARPGENVHPVGLDLRQGQVVVRAGTRIGPSETGLLATVGASLVRVVRRPTVAVLATGDELVEPDQTPPPGSIRDSNRFALIAAARDAGADVVWQALARDDAESLEGCMRAGLQAADVLITSGGVSMGTRDLIKPLMARLGTIHFGRISFKPGKPLTFATTSAGKMILGLPGFPVSSLVTFEVFVRPALRQMGGYAIVLRPRLDAVLDHDVQPDPVRLEYQRAVVQWQNGQFHAASTGVQSSSRLMSVAGANALLEIKPSEIRLGRGTTVSALLLTDL